ncbi:MULTISPECIES: LppX_LprAFG lipoprotein [unclassified Streptomyces]|uniref:LppX_LprAFG lipoprotein n=1 Tax=unclassified Streptomyces TaxID=2593676 RepID=UPI00093B7EDE|nr:LppX_LprAFG lipoprotein [Streptomyces sp. TSRI0107]OKJ74528.1 hypothetical protein AMK31_30455 [Streptomyces sp. TSRI0107]
MARSGNGSRIGALSVAGVLAGTVLVTGCGNDSDAAGPSDGVSSTGSAGAREQGTQAVRSAYDKTAEEDTARVTLKVRTSAEGSSATANGEGTVDLDDGDSVMTVTAEGQRIEQRVVDRVLYQKPPEGQAPGGKPWIKIDLKKVAARQGAGGQSVNDPAQSAAFAKAIDDKDVTRKGTSVIDGVHTTRYRVTVDVAKLPNGSELSKQVGPSLPMDLWLDDDGRIRRQQVDMTVKAATKATVRTVLEFSDFGTDVNADAPPARQVTDMTDEVGKQGRAQS